jgi:hypothetical protein
MNNERINIIRWEQVKPNKLIIDLKYKFDILSMQQDHYVAEASPCCSWTFQWHARRMSKQIRWLAEKLKTEERCQLSSSDIDLYFGLFLSTDVK